MFDRIVNILVIERDEEQLSALLDILQNPGHNVFTARNNGEALKLINSKNFVVIFCSLDIPKMDVADFIRLLNSKQETRHTTVIVTSSNKELVFNAVKDIHNGAVDYLIRPFLPNLVKAKLSVYKKLHHKHQRVSRLLESILPAQTLSEFRHYGKSSPKKKENCSVLFTDFVNFTQKTKNSDPHAIVQKLDNYFTRFDEIILKYRLEKIKTIGDAYMAVAGVTEQDPNPAIRTALAAMEIRNFMRTDGQTLRALGRDFWQIRIGIHSGDLVAGVVGKHKFSFDVWGDTVNIAARCEQNSTPNEISVSQAFYKEISDYFDCTERGPIKVKNAGNVEMYFLNELKEDFSLYSEGRIPNIELRKSVGLPMADFQGLRSFVLNKLKAELSEKLLYHSVEHTEGVEQAVIKYGELEKLTPRELFLTRTAALFHDTGFLFRYDNNEALGVEMLRYYAPQFGYQEEDLAIIESIILSTIYGTEPQNLMEAVMCDADLDYLGKVDYHVVAEKLFNEMALYGIEMTQEERVLAQIDYLEQHHRYYTTSAINLREPGKKRRIAELKTQLKELA